MHASAAIGNEAEIRARGQQIYKESCLSCHGVGGVGVKDHYADALVGDSTVGELTKLVAETMPEENPESCVGDDAAAVASYIHHSFYSEAAQVRNRPPRIRLARLTGEQLRQSLAGIYAAFGDNPWLEDKYGAQGLYFDGTRWKDDKRKIKRIDPVVDFDFGDKGPGKGVNPKEFFIQWSGSIKPDRSGKYEIVVRSTCSFVMDFGRDKRELINNHVQSEGRTEFRRTVYLTGHRPLMFKIDFYQRKRKTKQPPASLSLSWVPPGGVEEIIPQRNLLPSWHPAAFSLQAKLPPDDRSYGYERGTDVNRQWDDSTTQAAVEFAQRAVDELWPNYQLRHRKDNNDNRARLRNFLKDLAEIAFRGPLSDEQKKLYVDQQIDQTPDDAEAIKRVCLIALKSPRFLYPSLDSDRSVSQRTANRMSLILHDSLPTENWLRQKIKKNQLVKDPQLVSAAYKMVADYRTQAKMRMFLYEWFDVAHKDDVSKDREKFPGFDKQLVSDLRSSFDAFLDEVTWSSKSDYRQLVQADWTFTNDRLAKFYGDSWKPADGSNSNKNNATKNNALKRSVSDPDQRIGALSHPFLMSVLSYHKHTSPIHRGVFLYRKVLGRNLRPPNAAFSPLNPELHPKLTTRERVELQTDEANCQVCHAKINSLGFSLENFDTVGRFRSKENGRPINATGGYTTRGGESVQFKGPRELADFLASNQDSHRAFVDSCFEYFVKQPINAYSPRGPDAVSTLDRLTKSFQNSGFNMRELLVAIAVTVASHNRDTVKPGKAK